MEVEADNFRFGSAMKKRKRVWWGVGLRGYFGREIGEGGKCPEMKGQQGKRSGGGKSSVLGASEQGGAWGEMR